MLSNLLTDNSTLQCSQSYWCCWINDTLRNISSETLMTTYRLRGIMTRKIAKQIFSAFKTSDLRFLFLCSKQVAIWHYIADWTASTYVCVLVQFINGLQRWNSLISNRRSNLSRHLRFRKKLFVVISSLLCTCVLHVVYVIVSIWTDKYDLQISSNNYTQFSTTSYLLTFKFSPKRFRRSQYLITGDIIRHTYNPPPGGGNYTAKSGSRTPKFTNAHPQPKSECNHKQVLFILPPTQPVCLTPVLVLFYQLFLNLSSCSVQMGFPAKILYMHVFRTCPALHSLPHFIILLITYYISLYTGLNILHWLLTWLLADRNVFSTALFPIFVIMSLSWNIPYSSFKYFGLVVLETKQELSGPFPHLNVITLD